MQLPIDVVPGSNPPRFRWKQVVDTPVGRRVVDHEDYAPASMEVAVAKLVAMTRQLAMDNASMQGQLAAQAEQLSKHATAPVVQSSSRRGRG